MTTFKEFGLNKDIMKSLDELGFVEPTPIQAKSIPFILESKKDLTALAQTGTGKTAAFSLPILNQIEAGKKDLQAIILCPTRELCLQIFKGIKDFAKYSKGISVTAVYGGERIDLQIRDLKRGTNIVVGTPGRVHDLIRRKVLKLQSIKWLVLDEADEMLDMGFKDDLDAVLEQVPDTKQTLLFSATMSRSVHSISKRYMKDTHEINIGTKNIGAEKVSHEYYVINTRDRFEALKRILDSLPGVYGILFCRTRNETQDLAEKLKRGGYDAEAIHGDVSQDMRTKIMDRFRKKRVHILVATDVAARGIDVSNLTHVINYNLPDQNEAYTHRSGRTGRAQQSGVSMSIIGARDMRKIKELERIIGKGFEYKKVPSRKDVFQKQVDKIFEEIEKIEVKDTENQHEFLEIAEKLKKINKEDLIKYFITHKFSHLIDDYKNDRDLNAKAHSFDQKFDRKRGVRRERVDENSASLKINFGKKDGFDIKGLFGLVNSSKKLRGMDIGRISLMPEHSIFSVEKSQADIVIKQLKGINFKGKKVDVSQTSSVANYNRPRRSGSGGGFGGSRSNRGFRKYR